MPTARGTTTCWSTTGSRRSIPRMAVRRDSWRRVGPQSAAAASAAGRQPPDWIGLDRLCGPSRPAASRETITLLLSCETPAARNTRRGYFPHLLWVLRSENLQQTFRRQGNGCSLRAVPTATGLWLFQPFKPASLLWVRTASSSLKSGSSRSSASNFAGRSAGLK